MKSPFCLLSISRDSAMKFAVKKFNKSGWWQLIAITIIGIIPLMIWFCSEGTRKNNSHGKPIILNN